jgi:hypothetical protein
MVAYVYDGSRNKAVGQPRRMCVPAIGLLSENSLSREFVRWIARTVPTKKG